MQQALALSLAATDGDESDHSPGHAAASPADGLGGGARLVREAAGCALLLVSSDSATERQHDAGELLAAQRSGAGRAYRAAASCLCELLDPPGRPHAERAPSAAAAELFERAVCGQAQRAAWQLASLCGCCARAHACAADVLEPSMGVGASSASSASSASAAAAVAQGGGRQDKDAWAHVGEQLASHDHGGALAATLECALLLRVARLLQLRRALAAAEAAAAAKARGSEQAVRARLERQSRLLSREVSAAAAKRRTPPSGLARARSRPAAATAALAP